MTYYPIQTVAQMAWPTDWSEAFGRDAPLILEIGFGTGTFLLDLARRRPDANIIGVEISRPALAKAESKLARAGYDHVRLVHGGGLQLLWSCFRPETISEIYVNFADPWPKHPGRRLINDRFLALAATRLVAAGQLDVATDHAGYADHIGACLGRAAYLQNRLEVPFATDDPGRRQTKYELKGLAEGRICHYFKYERAAAPPAGRFPMPEEYEMPHIVLRTSLTLPAIKANFSPFHEAAGETNIRYIQLYENVRDQTLMVETHIAEPYLAQQLGLTIRARAEEELIIRLADIGFPRPTGGTHEALQRLANWLLRQDGTAAILHSNLRAAS